MYSSEVAQQVRSMKGCGMSSRAIAKKLSLSRNTVKTMLEDSIAEKRRVLRDEVKAEVLPPEKLPRPVNPDSVLHANGASRKLVYERCSSCGGMIQNDCPCLRCRVRDEMAASFDCYLNELLAPSSDYPTSSLSAGSTQGMSL